MKKTANLYYKILFFVLACVLLSSCRKMSDEERAELQKAKTHEYEVVSVYQYIKTETNNFGAITRQDLRYAFTYIGNDGQLHQVDDFKHLEYGLWKVCIGDENKYVVVEDGLDTYEYLYLTKETLQNIKQK